MVEKSEKLILTGRVMRNQPTKAEKILWDKLRGRRLLGLRFKRQCVIGRLIVDFYCPVAKLVVEIGGDIHDFQKEYDGIRTRQLEDHGYHVMRFWNEMVVSELDRVLSEIGSMAMQRIADLTPNPSPEIRRGESAPLPLIPVEGAGG